MHRSNLPQTPLLALALALALPASVRANNLAGDLSDDTTGPIGPGLCVVTNSIKVPAGKTLTIAPGTILKVLGGKQLTVAGTLLAAGGAGNPIVFTSFKDDTQGGDSNQDGSLTSPAPGDWRGIVFHATSTGSVLDHLLLRYHGATFRSAITAEQPGFDGTLSNSVIELGGLSAIDFNGLVNGLTVTGCTFRDNANEAVVDLRLDHVPNLLNNTASGNGLDVLRVLVGTLAADTSFGPPNLLQDTLMLDTTVTVPAGLTLTVGPGSTLKFVGTNHSLANHGTLNAVGTPSDPVVFTSFADDAHGGDTNGDGALTSPAPGDWRGILFHSTSTANVLDRVLIRSHGSTFRSAIHAEQAGFDGALTNSTIEFGALKAIDFNGLANDMTVSGCTFRDNGEEAVGGLLAGHVPNFSDNEASGNGGDFMSVVDPSPTGSVTIGVENVLNGALVFAASCTVAPGRSLTLEAGVVVKMIGPSFIVNGALDVLGEGDAPVVITSFDDDEVGGDTDGDGPATPGAPGQWRGLQFTGTTSPSTVRHLRVRFAGGLGLDGVRAASPLVSLRHVRVDECAADGFGIEAVAEASDLIAWSCGGDGFELSNAGSVRRVTAASNGGVGLRLLGAGSVRSAAAFGNAGGDYAGYVPSSGQVTHSIGSGLVAGLEGNLVGDPLFASAATGDLTLSPGSPCIDAGDPADFATGFDGSGVPRFADGDLDGAARIDMGALEFSNVRLEVTGNPTVGGSLTISVQGAPAANTLLFLSDAEATGLELYPYGPLGPSPAGTFLMLPWAPTPSLLTFTIPPFPTPITIVMQALLLNGPVLAGTPGNLSNVAAIVIE
ncbi:MAG: choice-of-anchor Q domain-containing protein [Planctomycetota bacterium JB042]